MRFLQVSTFTTFIVSFIDRITCFHNSDDIHFLSSDLLDYNFLG